MSLLIIELLVNILILKNINISSKYKFDSGLTKQIA